MTTLAFKMKLKPGCRDEYKKRHDEIWPELVSLLKNSGVSDYHIFLDEETDILFAVQKIDGDGGSQNLGTNPFVQKWWAYMEPLMDCHSDNSPISIPLEEVFFLA